MQAITSLLDTLLVWLADGLIAATWWQIVLFTLATTHVTIAAVTLFLHRAQAHRALDLHPVVAHFFRFWLWIGTGMATKEWVAIHRKHHAKCETVEDPHSPQIYGLKKLLLEGVELYRAESKVAATMAKYGHGTPDDWVERHLYSRYTWQGVGLLLIVDLLLFGVIGATVWAVQMAWIPVTAAGIINGIGHYWGYRNFEAPDASTNIFPWGIVIGGEELHNNHHTYPTSAKFSVKPYEFDIGWLYIRLLERVGLAHARKTPPKMELGEVRPVADGKTLEALIANRYEVMANYAAEVKRAAAAELARLKAQGAQAGSTSLRHMAAAQAWLHRDMDRIPQGVRPELDQALRESPKLAKLLAMREELRSLWTRRNVSAEQLVADLQGWCRKAEASGNMALFDFARMLRALQA